MQIVNDAGVADFDPAEIDTALAAHGISMLCLHSGPRLGPATPNAQPTGLTRSIPRGTNPTRARCRSTASTTTRPLAKIQTDRRAPARRRQSQHRQLRNGRAPQEHLESTVDES